MPRPLEPPTIDELRELLRRKGLRATAPRIAVLRKLLSQKSAKSHGDLSTELGPEGWDRATIYRNLIDLTEAGLARRTDVGDHVWRFEFVREGELHDTSAHPHFICNACGDVACLPEEVVEVKAARGLPRAMKKKGMEIQIRGICDKCA
jgi:Fur family transcriptional regulator, ferric uptake regulator